MAWNAVEAIQRRLAEEGVTISKTSLCLLLKNYKETGTIADRIRPRSLGRKLQLEHLRLIDKALDKDDEVSSIDLRKMLQEKAGILLSISTVQCAKNHFG